MEQTTAPHAVTLPVFRCLRCGHEWHPRKPEKPRRCGACGDPNWDRERVLPPRSKTVRKKAAA